MAGWLAGADSAVSLLVQHQCRCDDTLLNEPAGGGSDDATGRGPPLKP